MYNTQKIANLIKDLCDQQNISVNQLLKASNVNKDVVLRLTKGIMPSADKIARIADYLQVSTDYLLGKTDNPAPNSSNTVPALSPDSLEQLIIDAKNKKGIGTIQGKDGDVIKQEQFTDEELAQIELTLSIIREKRKQRNT